MSVYLGSNPIQFQGDMEVEVGNDNFEKIVQKTISGIYSNSRINQIGARTFYNCEQLYSINFPNVNYLGQYCFGNCIMLSQINLPNVSSIGTYAFTSCYKLFSVYLPKISSIPNSCFQYCYSLSNVAFAQITYIGAYAFRNCYNLISLNLSNITTIPTLSGTSVFYNTPIGGYSASAGQFGSVYVPSSLYDNFLTATNWSSISSRIVSI